ncbi:hypothetical protein [Streptomyces iranensis]|uniref:hypothetical protein n=1 Tax=Streptomyces iranensis TaxID=576784 RepID=UPI0039B72677
MEPLTEHRGVADLVVYGYLRLARASTARQNALAASLAEYCRQHELLLSGVFGERSTSATTAFTGLMGVLGPGTYGVVLPTAFHLGPTAIAASRERQIKEAGARLLLIREALRPRLVGPRVSSPSVMRRSHRRGLVLGAET